MATKKSSKGKRGLLPFVEYLAFRALFMLFALLPLPAARALARQLSKLWWLVDARHRQIALNNLAIAFPEKSEAERLQIARQAYANMSATAAEFGSLPKMIKAGILNFVRFEGQENYQQGLALAMEKGVPMVGISAHMGNWEVNTAGHAAFSKRRLWIAGKDMHNPYVNDYVNGNRRMGNVHAIPTRNSAKDLLKAMTPGAEIGFMVDQNSLRKEAVYAPFFGKIASVNKGIALLALKKNAVYVPLFNVRDADDILRIIYLPPFEFEATSDRTADVQSLSARFNEIVESIIREHPSQWFWVHNRWKTRPPDESKS